MQIAVRLGWLPIVAFFLTAAALPAQLVMPGGTEPMFEPLHPMRAALPAQITVTATHQPLEALASQVGRIPRGLALYEVIACGRGEISTAQVRQALARKKLQLLAPALGVVVAERERARGLGAALRGLPDLAPLATLGMAAAGAPQAGTIAAAGISALIAGLRAGRDPRPVAMPDPGRLEVTPACAHYITLARWPSRGRGPEFVEATIDH